MSCNRNSAKHWRHAAIASMLAPALAGCAKKPPEVLPTAPSDIYRVTSGSPNALSRLPRMSLVALKTEICLEAGEQITIASNKGRQFSYQGPGCFEVKEPTSSSNAGAMMEGVGVRPPPPPPLTIYRIASGTSGVLARFPRGTEVTLKTVICLKAAEQVTLQGANGQSVTYDRPGCLRRGGKVSPENLGGFVFGWRLPASGDAVRAAK